MLPINKLTKLSMLAGVVLLSSCGGGSESSTHTTNGVAEDGYIKDATVCLDINSNNICDANEPSTKTANDGKFSLTSSDITGEYPIIIYGGIDTATDKKFVGILKNIVVLSDSVDTPLLLLPR